MGRDDLREISRVKRIGIQVKPRSKKGGVEKLPNGDLLVKVNAPPVDGKANEAVIAALSKYLNLPKSKIKLIKGETSKHKLIQVED